MIRVPGDKSIAHRALMLALLADGRSTLRGVPDGLDVAATRRAVETLGARVTIDGDTLVVDGTGGALTVQAHLDCANSGTTMRLLTGLLATRAVHAILDGDTSLRARPMRRVTEPLAAFGARIRTSAEGTAPLDVRGNPDAQGGTVDLALTSAQLRAAVLLAALGAHGTTTLPPRSGVRDHTERLLRHAGVALEELPDATRLTGPAPVRPFALDVPGDLSSAAFLLAAAAVVPGASVTVEDVGINPTRTAFLDVLRRFGAIVEVYADAQEPEPRGRITVTGAALHAVHIGAAEAPLLIDELPLVGILGAFAHGTTVVEGAAELRVKESDRISAFADAARAVGATVTTAPDGFAVEGPARFRSAAIVTRGDHRIAMAFSVLAHAASIRVRLDDEDCIAVSYPGFADALAAVA